MRSKMVAVLLMSLVLPLTVAWAGVSNGAQVMAAPVLDSDGKIAGYTYGEDESNHYTEWSGYFPVRWEFASHHIGVAPGPVAGVPFYLHAHVAVVAPTGPGAKVLISIDQDAGGLPLRVASTAAMPLRCSRANFSAGEANYEVPCRSSVLAESGHFVLTQHEPLLPGFQFDVEIPVVVDNPTSGTAAMFAMWVDEWGYALDSNNILAAVPVTVAAAPAPPPPPIVGPPAVNPPAPSPNPIVNPPAPTATVRVKPVSRSGKLWVDVDPNQGKGFWTFQVQRRNPDGSWVGLKTYKTSGRSETRKINLKRGTYRVLVNPKFGYLAALSSEVYLKR